MIDPIDPNYIRDFREGQGGRGPPGFEYSIVLEAMYVLRVEGPWLAPCQLKKPFQG